MNNKEMLNALYVAYTDSEPFLNDPDTLEHREHDSTFGDFDERLLKLLGRADYLELDSTICNLRAEAEKLYFIQGFKCASRMLNLLNTAAVEDKA